jgi:hypothetical protein
LARGEANKTGLMIEKVQEDVVAKGEDGPEAPKRRPPVVNTGNQRVAVAFPFAKIDIHEPEGAWSDIASTLASVAAQVARMAHVVTPDDETADDIAAEADSLARRLQASA